MTNTRMDSRVESLEKSQEEMRSEMGAVRSDMNQRLTTVETAIAKMSEVLNGLTLSLQSMRLAEPSTSSANSPGGNPTPSPLQQVLPADPPPLAGKLEIPNFDGTDPIGWLARAEQFFSIQQTCDDLKVRTAFISMEGTALHWLRWLQQHPALAWTQFTTELLEEFGGELTGPPIEQLAALRQIGTVDDFAITFRARVAQIPGLGPHIQLGLFLNGLKPAIRVRLRPNDVTDCAPRYG